MTFTPQNPLEDSLVQAATDPAHRPQFYRDLLKSDIFVINHSELSPTGSEKVPLTSDSQLKLQQIDFEGTSCIPIFTSLERLQAVLKQPVGYVAINALDFMKLISGTPLILNPGAPYGKMFLPHEIQSFVDGSIWNIPEEQSMPAGTKVLLGEPAISPMELITALTRFFETRKQVQRAWIGQIHNPQEDQSPHTILAIDAKGDLNDLMSGIGLILRDVEIPAPPVDVFPLSGTDDISNYFLKQAKPFYKRRRLLGLF